jgi:PAS domain S-box-containing protein
MTEPAGEDHIVMKQFAPDPVDASPRERGETLRILLEMLPAILWSTDGALRFTFLMGGSLRGLNQESNQILGLNLYQYFATQDPDFPPIAAHRRALRGEAGVYEIDWLGRLFASHLEPLRDAHGAIRGVLGLALDITEGLRSEPEIERSLSLLRATLDSTADGILVADADGRIVTHNRRFVEMWQIPEDVAASGDDDPMLSFMLDQLKEPGRFVRRTAGLYAQPEEESHDILELKDGRVFERYSPGQRQGNRPLGRVWSFRDITERERADQEREKAFALLQATLESTADGILVVNTDGKIVSFNRKFVEMWHIPDAIVGSRDDNRALTFVLDQLKDPDRFLKKVRDLYGHPESQSYDWLEFKDGRFFERYSQPHRVGDKVVGRVWSFRDVTDRTRMEEILRRQARTFEHIFDGVIVTDLSGRVIDWNPGAEKMFGYSKEEMLQRSPEILYRSPGATAPIQEMLEGMRKAGRWAGRVVFLRQDGTKGVCETIVVPHTDEYGRTVAVIFVHRDVTNREPLEEPLAGPREPG